MHSDDFLVEHGMEHVYYCADMTMCSSVFILTPVLHKLFHLKLVPSNLICLEIKKVEYQPQAT